MKRLVAAVLAACSYSGVVWAAPPEPPRSLDHVNIAALVSSAERLFIGGFDDGLYELGRDGTVNHVQSDALSPHINALGWSEAEQTLWVGTARGLVKCRSEQQGWACRRIGPSAKVQALLVRTNGDVVAGGDGGLWFVQSDRVRGFGPKQRAPFRNVWAIAEADGALYVGATTGLFWGNFADFSGSGATLSRASVVQGDLPDDWVTALLVQGSALQVGTYNSGVTTFRVRGPALEAASSDQSLGYVNPAGLFPLSDDSLAIATMDGLRNGAPHDTRLVETATRDVTAIATAHGGGYWLGTRHGLEWSAL